MLLIRHFADKLAKIQLGQVAQLTTLVFGDSVAWFKPSYILPALSRAYGDLGVGISATSTTAGDVIVNNGGSVPYNYTYHLTGVYYDVGVAGEARFGRGGGAARANTISIYYVKESGAGTFKVQTAIGNGAFTDESGFTNVDANNGSLALGIITLTKGAPYRYQVKFVGLTGRVKFYAPVFKDTGTPGIQIVRLDRGGLGLGDANTMDPALFVPYVQNIAPDCAFFEMKEGGTYATDLATHIANWQSALPKMDWVYMGTTPDSGGTAAAQNSITKSQAEAAGCIYWDGYTPCVDYVAMLDIGWLTLADGTHPTAQCNIYLARLLSRDLGLTEVLGEVSQAKVITDSVATKSLKVSSSYGTVDAVGAFSPALELTGPFDLDGTLTCQRNGTLVTGANGAGSSQAFMPGIVNMAMIAGQELGFTPGPPSADGWRIYAKDVGGKTALVAAFHTGGEIQIAIQP